MTDQVIEKIAECVKRCPECAGGGYRYSGNVGSPCYKCHGKGYEMDYDRILVLIEEAGSHRITKPPVLSDCEALIAEAVKAERERIYKEIERRSNPMSTNMYGISLSRADWQSITK